MKKSQALESQNLILLLIVIIFFIITICLYTLPIFKLEQSKTNTDNQSSQSLQDTSTLTPTSNTVTSIIDGDTFEIADGNIIRMLCIDTPEQGKKGYEEAKQFLEDLILNKEVRLEQDTSNTDKYARLLRYVYVNLTDSEIDNILNINEVIGNDSENQAVRTEERVREGEITEIFVNKELFQQGYATIFEVEPNVKRCGEIEG